MGSLRIIEQTHIQSVRFHYKQPTFIVLLVGKSSSCLQLCAYRFHALLFAPQRVNAIITLIKVLDFFSYFSYFFCFWFISHRKLANLLSWQTLCVEQRFESVFFSFYFPVCYKLTLVMLCVKDIHGREGKLVAKIDENKMSQLSCYTVL